MFVFPRPAGRAGRPLAVARALSRVALFFTVAAGAAPSPLELVEAERLALRDEPGRAALLAEAGALRERAVGAGQLPDPALRVGIGNFPIESGGFSTEGMTQAQLGLRQAFPPGRSRAARTRRFEASAESLAVAAQTRQREVVAAVRGAWLDAWYWQRAEEIAQASRPLFGDLLVVTRSLYGVGGRDQQDVLRAELELSRLDDRLIEIARRRRAARAELSRWVGDAAFRPLAGALPKWSEVPPRAVLRDALATHPALLAAAARVDARQAGVELARENYKPGWALDVGYGYRDGSLPDGRSRSDFVSLSVTVDLPVFRRSRQDRDVAAALAERRAASETREALLRQLLSRLDAEHVRWLDLGRRLELYETRILAQSRARAQAALSAYQSEDGDFADVMRGRIDELDARLEHIRLIVERAQSYAVLANLGGLTP